METIMTKMAKLRAFRMLAMVALSLVLFAGYASPARAQDASPRFPDPVRVVADYPDDAQRYAAFTVLAEAMAQAAPKPISQPDYARINAYQAGANTVLVRQSMEIVCITD